MKKKNVINIHSYWHMYISPIKSSLSKTNNFTRMLQACFLLLASKSSIKITTKSPHRNCVISEILRKSIRLKGLISCVGYFLRWRLSRGIMNRRLLSIHKRPSSANTPLVHLSRHSFNCGETLNLKRN